MRTASERRCVQSAISLLIRGRWTAQPGTGGAVILTVRLASRHRCTGHFRTIPRYADRIHQRLRRGGGSGHYLFVY